MFSNLHCGQNKEFISEYEYPGIIEFVSVQNGRTSFVLQKIFAFHSISGANKLLSDGSITIIIVTAETNLGNILETWGILFREVNKFSLRNRRFPRSMRSQGERPGCGSHVKRVDHGDAFNA